MINNALKTAGRNLLRQKKMVLVNIAGLGIGMAATILISLWVQTELSFDKYHPDADRIYRVKSKMVITPEETWLLENSQYILGEHAKKEIPEIENIARLSPQQFSDLIFHYNGMLISENKAAYVDDQWFNLFHYDFIAGSVQSFLKHPFSLIITASTAKRYFGEKEAIGKLLKIDSINYEVQAVVKDNPANSGFQYNVLIPIAAKFTNKDVRDSELDWGNSNYLTFIKLKPGAGVALVSAKLTRILTQNTKNNTSSYDLVSLKDIHFENDLLNSAMIHGNLKTVNIFIVLALVILITACINYVNLTTARAIMRSREISIRKIIGANRWHLFSQFMHESFLVSVLALMFALLLVQLSFPWFRLFTGMAFTQPLLSQATWMIIILTLVVSFLLNGLYPAFLLSSFQPLQAFRGNILKNVKDVAFRRLLVVVQFSVSIVLIIVTLVIYRQLKYIQETDLGYDRSAVFTFTIPPRALGGDAKKSSIILNTIKQELTQQSAISDVSVASENIIDFTKQSSGSFDWNGKDKKFNPYVAPLQVDQSFQRLMHIRLTAGRWFNSSKSDEHNVLLNETAVKELQMQEPVIGQRFVHQGDTGVIIGTVKDFHYRNLHEKIGALVIADVPGKSNSFYVKPAKGKTASAISVAQSIWEKYAPDDPFVYNFLDDEYNKLYQSEHQSYTLIALFAGIAIFVSSLGLLGLSTFAAVQKAKEISIRKLLGASIQSILTLLSAEFLKLVLIASIIAFPIGWWIMNKWLQGFSYRISLSWWFFILATGISLLITMATISIQLIRIAVANPVNRLRGSVE